ncbi:hypothetical protein ZTR_04767 [Talaromyces verruculosus]|nr:hypothetical protein ZTR_04767 [Talaromyces verruculosus]
MATNGYKNIILVGGGGSLGSVLLKTLLSEPSFKVSVLTRQSSKARSSFPSNATVIDIDDSYPVDALVKAFQGQDAVVNAITSFSVADQLKFIDAAIIAGVKRYVPSEFGLDNNNKAARDLSPVFRDKGLVQDYLRSKESTGLTWTAIACGMWIGWYAYISSLSLLFVCKSPPMLIYTPQRSLRHNFLGFDYAARTMTYTDDGEGYLSTTTLDSTALALNRILLSPGTTANQIVFLSDFATTQKDMVETIERLTGEKWQRKSINTAETIPALKEGWQNGNAFAGYGLINIGFTKGTYSGHFEPVYSVRNKELGLPETDLETVIREALKEVGHPGF